MLAVILRRALNNRLQRPGWVSFGRLLIADRRTPFFQFGEPDGRSQRMYGQVEKVWPDPQDRQQRDARATEAQMSGAKSCPDDHLTRNSASIKLAE
jgi:hypothetical protein